MSPESARILEFALASLVIELTPGPNMGYLALVAVRQGWGAGLRAVAGATVGLTIDMLAAAVGVAGLLLADGWIYQALRWAGVAYLAILAVEAWFQRDAAARDEPSARLFVRGLLSNLLNVKAVIFYVVVTPSFVDPAEGSVLAQTLLLGCVHLAASLAVHAAIVFGAASAVSARVRQRAGAPMRRAFALGIAATAVWLAWMTRR